MIKVLIADDHAVVRAGLKQIVADIPDMVVGGEAASGVEAIQQVREKEWDAVLLDISMPGKSGVETLKQIKQEKPNLPVLILTCYAEDQYAERLLKAGASGYLNKESAPEQLVAAIRKVARGGIFISQALAEKLALHLREQSERLPHERLSDREFEILKKLASGKTVTQIADEMFLSVKTVSTYRSRLLEKMGMQNNAELTYYAIKNGLVS